MIDSLRELLGGLIDYAGLFPPANLDMPHAVATYARHLDSDHAWMVGRFVCPITRLDQFALKAEHSLRAFAPIHVAGLASPMNHAGTMMGVAADDAERVRIFERDGWGVVDVLEARLPDDLVDGDPSDIPLALERYEAALRTGGMHPERIFYEVNRTATWIDRAERIVAACTRVPQRGFKIRCGGGSAEAYPSVEEVAEAVTLCHHLRVPFKATAGLHLPVRHTRPASGITEHGFFNVFFAGVLAGGLNAEDMNTLIGDREIDHFGFSDEHLAWKGHEAAVDAVWRLRRTFAISFGACDIDEPVEALQKAGLL